jgi:hypothetical protein
LALPAVVIICVVGGDAKEPEKPPRRKKGKNKTNKKEMGSHMKRAMALLPKALPYFTSLWPIIKTNIIAGGLSTFSPSRCMCVHR